MLNFIKLQTDKGITCDAECNCVRSDILLRAAIGYLGLIVVGRNPFQTNKIQFELYKMTHCNSEVQRTRRFGDRRGFAGY